MTNWKVWIVGKVYNETELEAMAKESLNEEPDKIEAIELDIIVDTESTTISRPPRICINSSPQLSRIDTVDTVDTEIQNQSPKRIFTDFSPEAETNIRDNQSNNLVTPTLLLTPTRNGNF